mgnify:CR=1 FL=1
MALSGIFVFLLIVIIVLIILKAKKKSKHKENINQKLSRDNQIFKKKYGSYTKLERKSIKLNKERFLEYYGKYYCKRWNIKGIYIHHNLNNNKYYVGQSNKLYSRVHQEIIGEATNKGCIKLYKDYKKGDSFEITLIPWREGMPDLDTMERVYIRIHESAYKGYNRTRGRNPYTKEEMYI